MEKTNEIRRHIKICLNCPHFQHDIFSFTEDNEINIYTCGLESTENGFPVCLAGVKKFTRRSIPVDCSFKVEQMIATLNS